MSNNFLGTEATTGEERTTTDQAITKLSLPLPRETASR